MHTLKLLSAFLKVNIQMSLAYRADTVVNILLNLMWLAWELLSLNIIFSNTQTSNPVAFSKFSFMDTLSIKIKSMAHILVAKKEIENHFRKNSVRMKKSIT